MSTGVLDDVRDGISLTLAPLTVEQYHLMIRDGILHDGEPIELIEGALVYKDRRDKTGGIRSHGGRHLRVLNKLMAILSQLVDGKPCHLQVQGPIVVSDTSEPEPDCCLVRGTPDDYGEDVPQAADVLVVFEVADSSLQTDRRTKQRLYAVAGIPTYWIINLVDDVIEVYEQPVATEQRFDRRTDYRRGDTISLTLGELGTINVKVEDVL